MWFLGLWPFRSLPTWPARYRTVSFLFWANNILHISPNLPSIFNFTRRLFQNLVAPVLCRLCVWNGSLTSLSPSCHLSPANPLSPDPITKVLPSHSQFTFRPSCLAKAIVTVRPNRIFVLPPLSKLPSLGPAPMCWPWTAGSSAGCILASKAANHTDCRKMTSAAAHSRGTVES